MPEPVLVILLIAAVFLVLDVLLAGGAVTTGCVAVAGAMITHPVGWVPILLILAVIGVAIGVGPWR